MTKEELIASGLLEGYVIGSISKEESLEVEKAMVQFPEVIKEIESIEVALIKLAESTAGNVSPHLWEEVRKETSKIRPLALDKGKPRSLSSIIGWAAALVCFLGVAWMLKQNNDLKKELRVSNTQNVILKDKVTTTETELANSINLLDVMRSKDFETILLPGNKDLVPDAYATVFYNKDTQTAYIDVSGLPVPPKGKVYQAWSLLMEPLTPTHIGLLSSFENNENKFYKLENVPNTEAFGITLEPEGGSKSPTLSQLYTIGTVGP